MLTIKMFPRIVTRNGYIKKVVTSSHFQERFEVENIIKNKSIIPYSAAALNGSF